jgi:hypothetical protein
VQNFKKSIPKKEITVLYGALLGDGDLRKVS